jgi:hypothetical protein
MLMEKYTSQRIFHNCIQCEDLPRENSLEGSLSHPNSLLFADHGIQDIIKSGFVTQY